MNQNFIFKNLEQVPNIYKCLYCLQIPQNPVFDTKCQFLICKKCFPSKSKYCLQNHTFISLSGFQIQLLNTIQIKCEYCQNLIQGKKLQKHSYQCLFSIKSDQEIYLEQQLLKNHHNFKCNKCQNVSINQSICKICKNNYCLRCSSIIQCCNKNINPNLSQEFNSIISELNSQCILCAKQFKLLDTLQHIVECPNILVKCYCENLMTRIQYQQHFKYCLTKLIPQYDQNKKTALLSNEIVTCLLMREFNTPTFQPYYIQYLFQDDYSTSGIIYEQ